MAHVRREARLANRNVSRGRREGSGRDSGGLYARTLTCTHQGCEVEPVGTGDAAMLVCPCHGSQFDRNGAVIHGPARSPLTHFTVAVAAGGNITIDGNSEVSPSTRTPVV